MNDSLIPESKEARRGEVLTQWGLKLTKVYFILLIAFFPAASFLGLIKWEPIAINEIGDFLAGVFGPLSIFWIVLGFMQQGGELRLQVAELARSVEQQKELVAVSRETLDYEREMRLHREMARKLEIQPKFVISDAVDQSVRFLGSTTPSTFVITNVGHDAKQVDIAIRPHLFSPPMPQKNFWARGESVEYKALISRGMDELFIHMAYLDEDGVSHRTKFRALKNGFAFHFSEIGHSSGEKI